tara:strand:+ start:604 stop:1659 length:1056 start_codon:yes stop_codon:yes gene_type:complete
MKNFNIENKKIGYNQPCFVIAEAGVNHNGDLEIAKKLIIEAKKSGADCIKFQTFKAERVVTANAPKANYQMKTTNPVESQLKMLKKCELKDKHHIELKRLCESLDIIFLSTPYNIEDVDFLDSIDVGAYKLASIHVAEPYFIDYVSKKGKPIIISTGMATEDEVIEAVKIFNKNKIVDYAFLQCTTNYPSKLKDANLLSIKTMSELYSDIVGYSDHTSNDIACLASISLGAKIIEKHFTLDKTLPGPDHSSSLTPSELKKLIVNIRLTEEALGSDKIFPTEIEKKNLIGMRRSIVSKVDINVDDIITEDKLTFKRPATGIKPKYIHKIIGKKAKTMIPQDSLISWDNIDDS